MDKQAFKQRMQNLKSYRENNPGKGYWDWKVEAFADGGVNNNIIGSYSNHTGTPTMYVPVTKEYEAVPEGFGEIVNVHTPEVTITPQSNISLVEAVDKGRRTAFENIKEAASYTPIVGDAMDVSDAVQQATQGNYSKAAILGGMALLPNVIQKPIQKFAKLFKSNKKLHDLNIVDARDYTSSKPNVINSNKSVIKYKRKPIIQQQKQNNMLDATEQNRNTIKPVGEFVHTQTISDNIDEYMYRDYLFNPDYDDRLNELRQASERVPELQQRYQRMLTDPNFTDISSIDELVNERNNLFDIGYDDIQYQFGMPELNQLSQPLKDLPFINRYELRNIALANNDRMHANDILNEYADILAPTDISQLQHARDRLFDLNLDIDSELERRTTELYDQIEDRIAALQGTLDSGDNVASIYNISTQPYNRDNLPEFFYRDEALLGDRKNASYFDMSPRQAVKKATKDFNDLQHGQAWHLTDDYSVSTDSYPLQLNLMSKYKDSGKINAVYDSDGNVRTMYLNSFGNLKGDAAVKRINKKIQNISEIIGEDLPKAVQEGYSIKVPQIYYRKYSEGGQIGDPEKERFYQATGRSSSGRPLEEGLKSVFSLENAANMTPIGDAISAKDTYDAVKNGDWLGAGLAALTVLPFVPSGLRNVKAVARYIPTVNRTEQSLINQALGNISKKRDYLSDIANSRNRVLEDINTIPYRNRAEQADKIFGTNYSETYDLLDDLYQHRYFDLPEVQPKDMVASGRLQAKPFAEERFNKTGVGAEPNEFDLWVNTGMYRDPMQLANHEMNHYTDYIISRNANTSINNNMLKQLENSLKQTDATSYYRKGTEQKAYMNQLRTMLKQNGDIQNLDEPVSSTLLKKYLDKMSDSDPIKKMFKQHKNINAYTKWFNTIPLLGTTALGANAYFNNNKDE